jgi:hypothetical protein
LFENAAFSHSAWHDRPSHVHITIHDMERFIPEYLASSPVARADDDTGSVGVLPAPPGVTPDLQNPRDAGRKTCIIIMSVCLGLVTILFFLRSYVKIRLVRNSFLEDGMYTHGEPVLHQSD